MIVAKRLTGWSPVVGRSRSLGAYAVVGGGRPEPSDHLIRQFDDDRLQGRSVTRFGRAIHESGARS